MAVRLRTFWYSYRLTIVGTIESIKALYCGVNDLCAEVPKIEDAQCKIERTMRAMDYEKTKELLLQFIKFVSKLANEARFTEPIQKWIAEINGRLTSDMTLILEYLQKEGAKIPESQRNTGFLSWSDDFLKKIVHDMRDNQPEKFQNGLLKFPLIEENLMPVEFLTFFFTFFMNTPLILPATHHVRRREYEVETYQDDVYDMNEILQIREKAIVWLSRIVSNHSSYQGFFILLGRAMKLGAWIGRHREMSYYRECRPDKLKEYYWAHMSCLSCQVRMPHCPFADHCTRIGECQRHHIVQRYDWNHLDLIYLRNLTTQFTFEEIYWHYKQGVVWEAMQLDEFRERLIAQVANQEPVVAPVDFSNISDYEKGEVVPLQPESPGIYPAVPIRTHDLFALKFSIVLTKVQKDAPEFSEQDQYVMALALSGHCHFACLESTILRSEVKRPMYVFKDDNWLKLAQRAPTQFALAFSNYVFTRFRIGHFVRISEAIRISTEESQKFLKMFEYEEYQEPSDSEESDEMEVEETQSDEDSDFSLADLMEKL